MDQGVTAPEDDDAELLKRMAQQRLLGKTETQILEEMVKSEMGLDMDLSFFDEPAPPAGGGGAASKTLTERQERLLSGKDIQVPAGVPMDSRYLDSLTSFIGDEASKAVESTPQSTPAEEAAAPAAAAADEEEAQVVAEAEARGLLAVQARADAGEPEALQLLEGMLDRDQPDDDATGEGGGGAGSDDAEVAQMLGAMFGGAAARDEAPAAGNPLAGEELWGRWSQNTKEIYLELYVDADTPADKVSCEVSVGFLDVRLGWVPLLSGRLAHGVLPDVDWTLDEGDGRKLVCINLEKRQPGDTPYSESLRAPADTAPLFASLRIGGREVGAPGLVKGRYVTLPAAPPKPASKEGSYGGFDGTCADMRGDTPPGLDPDKLPGMP